MQVSSNLQTKAQNIGSVLWIGAVFAWTWTLKGLQYAFSFRWIVDIVRWLIGTGGTVAESAFLLATLYVTLEVVANQLVLWVVWSPFWQLLLNQLCLMAFTSLPELIIFQAIAITYDHWQMMRRNPGKVDCWIWLIAFALPTAFFLVLTIVTICSFINLEAVAKTTVSFQTSGIMLTIRCLTGWWYGMVSMLFDKLGKRGYTLIFDTLREQIATLQKNMSDQIATLKNESATALEKVTLQLSESDTQKQKVLQQLSESATARTALEAELVELRLQVAKMKVTREKRSTLSESATEQKSATTKDNVTSSKSAMVESDTAKKVAIKKVLRDTITRGDKFNYKSISVEAGVSYGMVRKHAKNMLAEITQETPRLHVVGE